MKVKEARDEAREPESETAGWEVIAATLRETLTKVDGLYPDTHTHTHNYFKWLGRNIYLFYKPRCVCALYVHQRVLPHKG